jgi:pSer/pThr/pTyr-binding forkhead associated (FHA) protein
MDGVAHRIGSDPLILGYTEMENGADINPQTATVRRLAGQAMLDAPAEAGVTVNGEQLEGKTALAPGDRLRLGTSDREILVVTMVE